jgi:methylenetetrahydrofolate reductase (NADPH)
MTIEVSLGQYQPARTETIKQAIMDMMRGFSTETTPHSAAKTERFSDHVPVGTPIYITFLPGQDYRDTVTVAARLRQEGMVPVPHFAARSISSRAMLVDYLERVTGEAGVDRVLCIAGAVKSPLGEFSDSMQLLDTGLFDKAGIRCIGIAGHPEGSPDFPVEAAMAALKWKNDFAQRTGAKLYIATQFVFEAEPVIAWDKALNAQGNQLPIHVGIPGIANLKTLLNYAAACGIGNSINFLKRQNVTKLLRPQQPDRLIKELATYAVSDPRCGIEGFHFYPLGGLAKTALWTRAILRGDFQFSGEGLLVEAE